MWERRRISIVAVSRIIAFLKFGLQWKLLIFM
jgi:hypothetical protein